MAITNYKFVEFPSYLAYKIKSLSLIYRSLIAISKNARYI